MLPWGLGKKDFHWGSRTFVMGILNVTPDSFSDGGDYSSFDKAVLHARQLLDQGADILDLGGESTRPGASPVSAEEELSRIFPVLRYLLEETDAVISIDTFKPEVAAKTLELGAHLINDISGLRDPRMLEVLNSFGAPAVAMHMRGTPADMQIAPAYGDVVEEVREYLSDCLHRAASAGIKKVMVDPGIGFGKSFEQNLALLRHLDSLRLPEAPLLVGTSRKSFLGKILDLPASERDEGTSATVALAIRSGADVVRVHDVLSAVRVAKVSDAIVRGQGV
ncbi:MAG TPA: dihydropteroate synthase [Cyanobacteria bacterium UBA8530]|nr:dihydropteroate synthase [Cyanobacteria bacterium UBA8530]